MKLTISQEGASPIIIDIDNYSRSIESASANSQSYPEYLAKLIKPIEDFDKEHERASDVIFYFLDSTDDMYFTKSNYDRFKKICIDFLNEEYNYLKDYYSKEELDKILKGINSPGKGDEIAKLWIDKLDGTVLLLVDNTIEGFISFEDKKKNYHVSKLYVTPKCRGKKYATQLLGIAEERATVVNKDLSVSVVKTNEPALRLYRKFGFKEND